MTGYRLTRRDIEIFRAIHACRVLTINQIAAKFYLRQDGQPRNDVHTSMDVSPKCRERLKLLWKKRYLERRELPTTSKEGRKPFLYFLSEGAVERLATEAKVSRSDLGWRPRDNQLSVNSTLPHLIAINDVRISIEVDAEQRGIQILVWETEQALEARSIMVEMERKGFKQQYQLIPDSYFCLFAEAESLGEGFGHVYAYFLEIDMDTEHAPLTKSSEYRPNYFTHKVVKYLRYFASKEQYEHFDFEDIRVLTVTTDETRLEKLLMVTEKLAGGDHFWFTTFADLVPIKSALTKPIWREAGSQEMRTLVW